MRKLIELNQEYLIECDFCDYKIKNHALEVLPNAGEEYINKLCPKCGNNLLTQEDFNLSKNLLRVVFFINKWFSWITFFLPKNKKQTGSIKIHNGIETKIDE